MIYEAPQPGHRIVVVGMTGSGKTTLARELADLLDTPHYELDALHWQPDWTSTPTEEMVARVAAVCAGEAWIIDGNYTHTQAISLARADTLVWLDYPFPVIFRQLLARTLRRALMKETLWAGNRETLRQSFFSRDSILLYAVQSYRSRRARYLALISNPEPAYAHLTFIRLTSPKMKRAWMERLG